MYLFHTVVRLLDVSRRLASTVRLDWSPNERISYWPSTLGWFTEM